MSLHVRDVNVGVYQLPTEVPESDGTLAWSKTTMVVVQLTTGGVTGLGYTYTHSATATLIQDKLRELLIGADVMATSKVWATLIEATRNLGRPGIVSSAIAAIDIALWDLKARLLDISLIDLLGPVRPAIPVYGSGGFTSYSLEQLASQIHGWADQGISRFKMKVGRSPARDLERVQAARTAAGSNADLFVDANGAYDRKQALAFAEKFATLGVTWFEEPVSSDDLQGLRLLRDRSPAGMDIAAGEYGYRSFYFHRMLEAEAVDVLMADATRCSGITGFQQVAALCEARSMPLSCHTAPSVHCHLGCVCLPVRHLEYFHDHVRMEQRLFEGAISPTDGLLHPDRSSPGLGLTLKCQDAEHYAVH